jgi:hypothetical protein
MASNHLQMAYLPYISLASQGEIQIGRVKIWNYSKKAVDYITDISLRQHIDKIIKLNVDRGNPINDIGIVSIDDIDFRQFAKEEMREIHEACTLLFLSVLSSQFNLKGDNTGHFMRTSENFRCVIQNFTVGDKYIAEMEGMIIRINDMNLINKVSIHKPRYVALSKFDFRYDVKLLENMVMLKKRRKALFNRIVRATEVFRQSYYNSEDVNLPLRILSQMSSFETLLSLREPTRKNFKDKVELYCVTPSDKRYVHYYKNRGRKYNDTQRTIKGKWADSYYQLRNAITHGDIVKPNQFIFKGSMHHFDLAIMFFIVIIKKLINDGLKKKGFEVDIHWDKKKKGFEYIDRTGYSSYIKLLKKEMRDAKRKASFKKRGHAIRI